LRRVMSGEKTDLTGYDGSSRFRVWFPSSDRLGGPPVVLVLLATVES
jgi:hypothetical protein